IFVAGFDPDYVQISGVTVTPQGTLTVLPRQTSVQVTASESSDPADNLCHVTLSVAVAGSRGPARLRSRAGTASVLLRGLPTAWSVVRLGSALRARDSRARALPPELPEPLIKGRGFFDLRVVG